MANEPNSTHHVLVCGLGHVGYRVARLLRKLGVGVSVVEQKMKSEWSRSLAASGAKMIVGDPSDDAFLVEAGLQKATALVASANLDLENLEIALDARRQRPELRLVLRIFDRDLARSLEQSFGNARALGASALSAPVMAFSALGLPVRAVFDVDDAYGLVVAKTRVDESSPLLGKTAADVRKSFGLALLETNDRPIEVGREVTLVGPRASFLELAGKDAPRPEAEPKKVVRSTFRTAWNNAPRPLRTVFLSLVALTIVSVFVFRFGFDPPIGLVEAIYFTVTTVTTTGYGDISPRSSGSWQMLYGSLFMLLGSVTMAVLYSFATSYVVSEQLRAELGRPPLPRGRHVIVVGLGNVGYRTWDELTRAGFAVVAIDIDPEREFVNAIRSRAAVVIGEARLSQTLESAGLDQAIAVVAATGDDAVNLAVALTARRLAPKIRTVVRVFDADFAHKLEESGLVEHAISTSRIAAPTFAASALNDGVAGAFADEDGLVTFRLQATPNDWVGQTPEKLRVDVLFVVRDGRLEAWDSTEALPADAKVLVAERLRFA